VVGQSDSGETVPLYMDKKGGRKIKKGCYSICKGVAEGDRSPGQTLL